VRAIFGDRSELALGGLRGEVEIDGERYSPRGPRSAVKRGIAFVPEDRKAAGLVLSASVEENISLTQLEKLSRGGVLRRAEARRVSEEQVEALSIKTPGIEANVGNLSGGNQQKVLLARWLITEPKLLILDEPMAGMNQEEKEYIARFILDAREERDVTILIIEHHMDVVTAICDRIVVLSYGEIIAEGRPHEAIADPAVVAAYLGQRAAARHLVGAPS
jgi:branched-chain amino acid transport system ATP-binding protein